MNFKVGGIYTVWHGTGTQQVVVNEAGDRYISGKPIDIKTWNIRARFVEVLDGNVVFDTDRAVVGYRHWGSVDDVGTWLGQYTWDG